MYCRPYPCSLTKANWKTLCVHWALKGVTIVIPGRLRLGKEKYMLSLSKAPIFRPNHQYNIGHCLLKFFEIWKIQEIWRKSLPNRKPPRNKLKIHILKVFSQEFNPLSTSTHSFCFSNTHNWNKKTESQAATMAHPHQAACYKDMN